MKTSRPRATAAASGRYGLGGGLRSSSQRAVRSIESWSTVLAVTPAPSAAERLRSRSDVLLPSQCRCIPSRGPWSNTAGKSAVPISSFGSSELSAMFALMNL